MHNKKKFFLLATLLAAAPVFAAEGPFTEEEINGRFRAILFGINKEYSTMPLESRPEGCVTFELRIQRDGIASWFRRKEGDFENHALQKRIEQAVINRFDMPGDRLKEPQIALHTLCFSKEAGVTSQDLGKVPPPPAPKKTEELMEQEHHGVTNREWLEQLMATEGKPVEPVETKSQPQGTVLPP